MKRSLYRGDCLSILNDYIEPQSVDLVYLDPPFNSKSTYNLPFKGKDKTHKAVEAFKDTWTWRDTPDESGHSDNDRLEALRNDPELKDLALLVDFARKQDTSKESMGSYILSMIYRLKAIHRALKETGSIYLHCDPTASHYLKLVMDSLFGREYFRNEITWQRDAAGKGAKRGSKQWPRTHDVLLFYSKSSEHKFNQVYTQLSDKQAAAYKYVESESDRLYKAVQLGDYSADSIAKMREQRKIHTSKTGKEYKKYYLDEAQAT